MVGGGSADGKTLPVRRTLDILNSVSSLVYSSVLWEAAAFQLSAEGTSLSLYDFMRIWPHVI